jgi:DNA-directed RNA polymerase specialized sigma24 family protein
MVTPSDDTAALVHLAKIGSADAFRRLLESQYAVIFRMAFRLCGHREDAEDITQMTCLKIAQTIGTFRGDPNSRHGPIPLPSILTAIGYG